MRTLLALTLALAATGAHAAEKTLYKCRAADGSLAFQEAPCDGKPLATIPITAEPQKVDLGDPACRNMARDLWRLLGRVDLTEFGEAARQDLQARKQTFRDQCHADLERSQRAIECAVLAGAVSLSTVNDTDEERAKAERVKNQHKTECSQSMIDADIDAHVHPAR
jgi:hypothetical protein